VRTVVLMIHHPHLLSTLATDRLTADVLVVGGGAAGATAALVLARSRHRVLVADDRTYRNAAVEQFHGFPTRDGTAPASFRADVRRELDRYGVEFVSASVVSGRSDSDGLEVVFTDGTCVRAAAAVLATGVADCLPAIDGLTERWGRSVFNCPFCDGWEHRDRPVAVIDAAPGADHLAEMLRAWTPSVTVVQAAAVDRLVGPGARLDHVRLRDGTTVPASAVFVRAPVAPRSSLARRLGCVLDDEGYVVTDALGATSNPRVWAAGDLRRSPPAPQQVVLAAADGSTAAIALHKAFVAGALTIDR
jgi:thioredoxin reductase